MRTSQDKPSSSAYLKGKRERKEEDNVSYAIQLSARQTHLLILSSLQLTVKFVLVDLPQRNPVVSITLYIVSAQIRLSPMSCLLPSIYKYNRNQQQFKPRMQTSYER